MEFTWGNWRMHREVKKDKWKSCIEKTRRW